MAEIVKKLKPGGAPGDALVQWCIGSELDGVGPQTVLTRSTNTFCGIFLASALWCAGSGVGRAVPQGFQDHQGFWQLLCLDNNSLVSTVLLHQAPHKRTTL